MIHKITGILEDFYDGNVSINCNGLSYLILVSGGLYEYLKQNYKKNQALTLYTMYYIESGVGGSNLHPKLIGFSSLVEREFFEKYTTVKGLGIKTALKSMVISVSKLAGAIENGDIKLIKNLPGIGGRTAEKIIAELKGRVAKYALIREYSTIKNASELSKTKSIEDIENMDETLTAAVNKKNDTKKQKEIVDYLPVSDQLQDLEKDKDKYLESYSQIKEIEEEVIQILLELGYSKNEALELIKKATAKNPKISDTQQLIQEIFKNQTKKNLTV